MQRTNMKNQQQTCGTVLKGGNALGSLGDAAGDDSADAAADVGVDEVPAMDIGGNFGGARSVPAQHTRLSVHTDRK